MRILLPKANVRAAITIDTWEGFSKINFGSSFKVDSIKVCYQTPVEQVVYFKQTHSILSLQKCFIEPHEN